MSMMTARDTAQRSRLLLSPSRRCVAFNFQDRSWQDITAEAVSFADSQQGTGMLSAEDYLRAREKGVIRMFEKKGRDGIVDANGVVRESTKDGQLKPAVKHFVMDSFEFEHYKKNHYEVNPDSGSVVSPQMMQERTGRKLAEASRNAMRDDRMQQGVPKGYMRVPQAMRDLADEYLLRMEEASQMQAGG